VQQISIVDDIIKFIKPIINNMNDTGVKTSPIIFITIFILLN